ncbi:MAG: TraR/DksA C4-type zinc finger protein [Candidatus Wildermuthbacteria bacterium]|nr:TraR/DksA C4-type zinc finger protein [Candidatus Wildermuthbacteria bacterium]
MDNTILEQLKTQLLVKKSNLEKELAAFATKDPKLKGDWDSKYPRVPQGGLEEAANEVEEYSTSLPIEHSLELQLKDVNEALERIQKGTYGVCAKCKNEIAQERLLAMPEALLCGACSAT